MPYIITNECIMCDICVPECPENAIAPGDPFYIIDQDICNDCENCAEVCPVEACLPNDKI
ncbi:MAG: 4Fe-4S dicluster domain-containing protein [candidate division Zixibacteria bacterium]|nr:4Fe-4S dicluster domain-containing protein [candidate division Zixibacteria bacterium]